MPIQPAAVELLSALSNVLPRWGRWYVFGAQAVIAYGVPRLSADVDVTVALVPDEPEGFARDMESILCSRGLDWKTSFLTARGPSMSAGRLFP